MSNQKQENLLNLALDSTETEREKSLNLNVGVNNQTKIWTLIVRYVGSLENVRELGVEIKELLNGYAILKVPWELIETVSDFENIIFVEKPKRLNFALTEGRRASCISAVQEEIDGLYGENCIVAVIDSGIDYANTVFRNKDGSTRLLGILDQTAGVFYDREAINSALEYTGRAEQQKIVRTTDNTGHGTAVAAIAAGNFARIYDKDSTGDLGIATRADILAVKLGTPEAEGFPRTSELMEAVDFCVRYGVDNNSPMIINLSFGNTYGSHDGTSLLETYIDSVSQIGINTIIVGTGNEGAASGHTSGFAVQNQRTDIELAVGSYEPSLNLQIWKNYADIFDVEIVTPGGRRINITEERAGTYRYGTDRTELLIYYGEPSPFSPFQEIYIDFIPRENYITEGLWTISLYGRKVSFGEYDMWLPSSGSINASHFVLPTPYTTLTIPSTARNVISVGAYDSSNTSYASFSGRGFDRTGGIIKPDIVAPGVNITTAAVGGGLISLSGTSFATPFVSGSAALLCEWGIVKGNDRWLYGEKVKAYMIRGAKQLPGEETPSRKTGWGALCVRDSLPEGWSR